MSNPLDALPRTGTILRQLVFGLVLAATLALAALHYWQFLQNPRPRWNGLDHDRNGHYEFAQKMALALREADLRTFLATLEKAKVWPPVHGLLAASVLTVGGLDYRLAVLPSLVGWVMTAVFGFLLARRISAGCGNAAGVVAAVMILASPAHRIYGTDIMLESLGAGLTMLVLYLYTNAKQEPSPSALRRLAIALTVLFFEKYNYWLLVVLALGLAEVSGWRAEQWIDFRRRAQRVNWSEWLRTQSREPLNYLFVATALLTTAIFVLKPAPLLLGSHRLSLYPPNNLVTVTYVIFFFRVIAEWKRRKTEFTAHPLLRWHCLPVAISLLLPQRLSAFAWFLGPLNSGESAKPITLAAAYYRDAMVMDYHISMWSAVSAAVLFVLALVTFTKLRPGGRALVLFVLIAVTSTVVHPNQKSRYLHSWFPAVWVAGAAGLATCIARTGRLRHPLAMTTGAAVILAHAPSLADAGHAPENGCHSETTSLLDLPEAYLPALANLHRVAVFSTTFCDPFVLWTHRERYRRLNGIELPLKDHRWSTTGVQPQFKQWTAVTDADAILFIDISPGSPDAPLGSSKASAEFRELMREDQSFALLNQWNLPQHACTVTLWERQMKR